MKITVITTPRELLEKGLWVKAAQVKWLNPNTIYRENGLDKDEEIVFGINEAHQAGMLENINLEEIKKENRGGIIK